MAYKLLAFFLLFLSLKAQAQTPVLDLKSDVIDTIFGQAIADPYRWMEDPESDSLNRWLKEENKLTKAEQKNFHGRLTNVNYNTRANGGYAFGEAEKANANYEFSQPEKDGGRFFALSRGKLYSRKSVNENWRVAFDTKQVDWKHLYKYHFFAVSDSNNYLAISISKEDDDWQQIRVSDMDSSLYFPDVIDHGKFTGIAWWRNGFFYGRYPDGGQWDTTAPQKLFYHTLGQKQEQDELITSSPSGAKYRDIQFWVSSNKRYLVISKNQKIGKNYFFVMSYKYLSEGADAPLKHLIRTPIEDTCYYRVIDYSDSGFLFCSNYLAPHGRILKADMNEVNSFTEVVGENGSVLKSATYVYHQLVALYYTAGLYSARMYNDTGGLINSLRFATGVTEQGFSGLPEDTEVIFYEQSFCAPPVFYRYNFITRKITAADNTRVTFNPNNYTTQIVNYKADDGTDIPMFLAYKKGLSLKANNPVILSSYGGFGVSETPGYSFSNIIFFESGGILVVPMIRGGGEEGGDWHAAARQLNKQKSFDDFAAAARYLIQEGYTSKDKLAFKGYAMGGLVVTTVMVQHPDLCKVVVSESGIYDMLRYNKFTSGKYWINEFGEPDNSEDFKNLLSYSPLHNLKSGVNYPATLLVAWRDAHIAPIHTYKFLARLQQYSVPGNPHIIYFEEDDEHRSAFEFYDSREENAFELAFIFTQMNLPIKYMF